MSATRNMHISLGFLDPCNSSSPNTVTHTGWGIQRIQATKGSPSKQVRLPITSAILNRLRIHREATKHKERLGLWAVAALCFAGFFRLGELLPSLKAQEKERGRLLWVDITVDNARTPLMLLVQQGGFLLEEEEWASCLTPHCHVCHYCCDWALLVVCLAN